MGKIIDFNKGKYSLDLVRDYINGNDIIDYDINELENDYDFMTKVIDYTCDKEMYNLCSLELRNSYKFIKYLVCRFNSDLEFIDNIARDFIRKSSNRLERLELILIMKEYTTGYDEYNMFYSYKAVTIYFNLMTELELCKMSEIDNQRFLKRFGVGFSYILYEFESSDIVINYLTEKIVHNLMEKIDLEKKLHLSYKDCKDMEKTNICHNLIRIIANYDMALANYLVVHPRTLKYLKEEIEKIKCNWNDYIILNSQIRYEALINELSNYFDENMEYSYCFGKYLVMLAREFNVLDMFLELDENIKMFCFDDTYNVNMNFNELGHYINMKKIFKRIITPVIYDENKEENDIKPRFLTLKK